MEKHWLKSYPPGVRPEINVNEYSSLKELIERGLAIHAVRDAYVQMGKAITFGELDILSARFGAFLQSTCGLGKGDRVAVMLPNTLQYPIAVHGALRAGLTVVNTNPLYTAPELEHQLADSRCNGNRHPGEFRARAAGSDRAHTDQTRCGHQRRRDAGIPERCHRRFRRSPQAKTGEALQPARKHSDFGKR